MSEDLKDILTLSTYVSDYNKKKKSKKDGEPKKKPGNSTKRFSSDILQKLWVEKFYHWPMEAVFQFSLLCQWRPSM